MIKNISWFVLLLLTWSLFSFQILKNNEVAEKGEEGNHLEMLANQMEQEFEMTRDPLTGDVPRERLVVAQKNADKLRKDMAEGKIRNAIPNFMWNERGPSNVGGRTRALLIDANDASKETVWAGSVSGGLWKTTNFSNENPNWTPIDEFWTTLAISAIEQDPSNLQNIYVGTGEGWFNSDAVRGIGIWKSSNGGNTWTQLSSTNNSNFYFITKIEVASNGDVYVATKEGLYRSQDGGSSFTQIYNASSGYITDIEITSSAFFLAHRGNGIYTSPSGNSGTWAKLTAATLPAAGTFFRVEMISAPSDPLRLYALFENSTTRDCPNIYRSSDGGTTWTSIAIPVIVGLTTFTNKQAWYNLTLAVDPTNKETVWVGGVYLKRSLDGGTTWANMTTNATTSIRADHHCIIIDPTNTDNIYFANDGGVCISNNGKSTTPTFTAKSKNYNVTQFYSCAIHPTAGKDWFIAGAQDNGTQLFQTPSIGATKFITTGDGAFTHIHQDTPNVQMSAYVYNHYFFTRDSWASTTTRNVSATKGQFVNPSDYDDKSNYLYAGHGAGKLTTIKVNGIKNGPIALVVDTPTVAGLGTAKITAVTVSPNTANLVFVGLDNGNIVKMSNAHLSSRTVTTIRTSPSALYVSCIAVEDGNDNHLLITYSNYGATSIYETTDGGTNWVNVEGGLADMPIRWIIFNPNNNDQAVIATELGVYSTDNLNGGSTDWTPSIGGLANVRVNMLQYRKSDKLLIAATHGRGLYSSDVFTVPTASFTAKNPVIYPGKAVQFVNASFQDTQWAWDFGDGTTANTENPLHTYHNPGYYNVNLTINNGASSKTINTFIHVMPYAGTPYTALAGGDFETPGQFESVSLYGEYPATNFERGSPAAGVKTGTASPSNAWATALTGNYLANSTAMLYSPCFSCLELGNYTVKFKARFNIHTTDGFQVQYSLDKGDTWNVLGVYDPPSLGGTWYNFENTGGATTMFPINDPYFSGTQGNLVFIDFAHTTTAFQAQSFVAFRFLFKSDGGSQQNGVVIDDFEIDGPLNMPLPLDVAEFTGDYKDEKVVLNWHTETETNCKGFEVQRSLDGLSFEIIGWQDGHGSTGVAHSYVFNDNDIKSATQYYRLKQVDFDGSIEYSNIVQVFIFPEKDDNMFAYPNPFADEINLRLFEPIYSNERLKVRLIDTKGVVLAFIPITETPPIKSINLDLTDYNLPSGLYYLELYAKGTRISGTKIIRK